MKKFLVLKNTLIVLYILINNGKLLGQQCKQLKTP